jgi:uncharacterized protein YciI
MAVFAVRYDYADNPQALDRVRPAHRETLARLYAEGSLLAVGPLVGASGALLVVAAPDATAALKALEVDPFLVAGLIDRRQALEWTQVFSPWKDR